METVRKVWWPFADFGVHIEWLSEGCAHAPRIGTLRVFEAPLGQIDAETGQPWKAFCWSCNLVLRDATMVWCNAMTGPLFSYVRAFKTIARELGMERAEWERWHEGRKLSVEIKL